MRVIRRRTKQEDRRGTRLLTLLRVDGVVPLTQALDFALGLVLVGPSGGAVLGLPGLEAAPISAAGDGKELLYEVPSYCRDPKV